MTRTRRRGAAAAVALAAAVSMIVGGAGSASAAQIVKSYRWAYAPSDGGMDHCNADGRQMNINVYGNSWGSSDGQQYFYCADAGNGWANLWQRHYQ